MKCITCKEEKLENEFSGKTKRCKLCTRKFNRNWANKNNIKEKFIPFCNEKEKQCCKCKIIKSLDEFSNSKRGRMGKAAYCKPCNSKYQLKYTPLEKRREKTQKYRNENREWWRSLHRINQFNRKNKIKLLSDNTVTEEFVKTIYSIENCYYCKEYTPNKFRTLEHINPLNKGGLHSSNNITMACLQCNCTKRDMTEKEFMNYKKQNNE